MTKISRRDFIAASALAPAALSAVSDAAPVNDPPLTNPGKGAWARWLDGSAPAVMNGATWGMPWPKGKVPAKSRFALRSTAGNDIALQSWPLAYWPDGSLKWTAHALPAGVSPGDEPFEIVPRSSTVAPRQSIKLAQTTSTITIDTGMVAWTLSKSGRDVISSAKRSGRELLRSARLVLLRQDRPSTDPDGSVLCESFNSAIETVTIEQRGPVRCVIRIEGRHRGAAREWLPFTLRLYFYAGSDALRVMHTIVFDGDESRDFIRGLGLRFDTPLDAALHDRHVRFAGDDGVFGEAVRGLTGLRRDPGAAVRESQLAGAAVGPMTPDVGNHLDLIPAFGDWTLLQPNADSFTIRKRTRDGHAWLDCDAGRRAAGTGYIGSPAGGVAFGVRNFWQSHPAQLDIRNAVTDTAQVTLWVWAPDATAMDLRFYHDGLGQDTFEKQLEGLEITYEDYEPGFGTPVGVARTSELLLTILDATPTHERFGQLARSTSDPAVVVATPQTLQDAGVFGRSFSRAPASSPRQQRIERQLDWFFDFYRRQQDQRRWYGFWNYGDVMHTYDADRHVWRYDVGGFAWDNSELATDIWLWLHFLRSGRADVYRFAEAMTRHTGEVDVHHLGRFAPLGSRHNVMHWGCSAKQLRISTALNRRYYFYLTGDERVGDLMREQVEAVRTLRTIQPHRKLAEARTRPPDDPDGNFAHMSFGTDWGSIAGAWLTEWERTNDPRIRDRLLASMRTIADQPRGFFTGDGRMNLTTGAFDISRHDTVNVSHLSAAFGLPEVCIELIELLAVPEFESAWLRYCELYNAPAQQQQAALGKELGPLNLEQGHARLTAYAAYRKQDAALATRAWSEFDAGLHGYPTDRSFESQPVTGARVLHPVDEAAWVSTNATAQWGLAAIECLAFAGLHES